MTKHNQEKKEATNFPEISEDTKQYWRFNRILLRPKKKECKHDWRVGGKLAGFSGGKIIPMKQVIYCYKCHKKIYAKIINFKLR